MTEWHNEWKDRAQIAEGKLLLLEAPKSPQDAEKQEAAPIYLTETKTPPGEKLTWWQRVFGKKD